MWNNIFYGVFVSLMWNYVSKEGYQDQVVAVHDS